MNATLLHAIAPPSRQAVTSPPRANEGVLRVLVQRIKDGELNAFEQLYRLTREDVTRILAHLVGRRPELEDLVQETFLRLLSAVKSFRGESQFRTFLYRICANVALSHLRWQFLRAEQLLPDPPDRPSTEPDPESEVARMEATRLVEAALSKLSAKKRIIFVYHELYGMEAQEIGHVLGTSANTVRSRLYHARLEFAKSLKRLLVIKRQGGTNGRS